MANPTAPPKLKVIVFAASLRVESLNAKLAALAARASERAGAAQGIAPGAQELRRRLIESDAFIISSPEYNASMPGIVKNLIDWTRGPGSSSWASLRARVRTASIRSLTEARYVQPLRPVRRVRADRAYCGSSPCS